MLWLFCAFLFWSPVPPSTPIPFVTKQLSLVLQKLPMVITYLPWLLFLSCNDSFFDYRRLLLFLCQSIQPLFRFCMGPRLTLVEKRICTNFVYCLLIVSVLINLVRVSFYNSQDVLPNILLIGPGNPDRWCRPF